MAIAKSNNNLTGVKLDRNSFIHLYQQGQRDFSGAILDGCDLSYLDLSGINFSNSSLKNANFNGANLLNATFANVKHLKSKNFKNTLFHGLPDSYIKAGSGEIHSLIICRCLLQRYLLEESSHAIFS